MVLDLDRRKLSGTDRRLRDGTRALLVLAVRRGAKAAIDFSPSNAIAKVFRRPTVVGEGQRQGFMIFWQSRCAMPGPFITFFPSVPGNS